MAHIRKTQSQLVNIGTDQGIGCKYGNVISDQHQITGMKRSVHAACRICQEQDLGT